MQSLLSQSQINQICNILKFRNDISFHSGEHWCSRPCENAIFLCGNSYYNSHGDVTKCGHIAYSFSQLDHRCKGSYDLYFNSRNSQSTSYPSRNSRRSRRFSRSNESQSWRSEPSDHDVSDDYFWYDELDMATDYYYYSR